MSSRSAIDSSRAELPDFGDVPDVPHIAHTDSRGLPLALEFSRVPLKAAPTRADVRRRHWIALGLVVLWALAQFAALGLRFDFHKLPVAYVAATILLPFAVGVIGIGSALHPGRAGLGARESWLRGLMVLGTLVVIASALLLPEPYAGGIAGDRASIFVCGNIALAWAAMPIAAASVALRGSFIAGATWRSALIGTACGLGAAVAAQLRCPVTGALHIALAHGAVVVISTLLGALLLARATRV